MTAEIVATVDHATAHVTRVPLVDRDPTVPPVIGPRVVHVQSDRSAARDRIEPSVDLAPNVRVDPLSKRKSDSTRAVFIATLCSLRSHRSSSPLRNNFFEAEFRLCAKRSSIKTRS